MTKLKIVMLSVSMVITLNISNAKADPRYDGSAIQLYNQCLSPFGGEITGYCHGYIVGLMIGYQIKENLPNSCVNFDDVNSSDDVIKLLRKYFRLEEDNQWNKRAEAVFKAIKAEYPCEGGTN